MANGLYSPDEIARMTDNNLDELEGYYADTGNAEGLRRVRHERDERLGRATPTEVVVRDPKQTWHVAVGDTAPFGALHVYHVEAHSDVEAAFLAGSAARRDHGAVTATWTVRDIQSEAERQQEMAHEAAQELAQMRHDEMVDDMLARDGRFG